MLWERLRGKMPARPKRFRRRKHLLKAVSDIAELLIEGSVKLCWACFDLPFECASSITS